MSAKEWNVIATAAVTAGVQGYSQETCGSHRRVVADKLSNIRFERRGYQLVAQAKAAAMGLLHDGKGCDKKPLVQVLEDRAQESG